MSDIKSHNHKTILMFVGIFYFAIRFFYQTLQSTLTTGNNIWSVGIMAVFILFTIGFYLEFKMNRNNILTNDSFRFSLKHLNSIGIVILNTVAVYLIVNQFSIPSISAASLSCLLSVVMFSNYEPEAYSGSLTGMVGLYLCESWSTAIGIGLVSGFMFILFIPYFNGIGGRGGTIPFIATLITVRLFLSISPGNISPIHEEYIVPSLFIILFIALLTYSLHYSQKLTPVKAGMLVTFIFSILLSQLHVPLVTAMFLGTIIGMSSPSRFKHSQQLVSIGIIAFILFVPSFHLLDGVGGKLGFLCFVAYHASIGEEAFRFYFKQKMLVRRKSPTITLRKMTPR